ncbi:MAG: hypothetical protein NTY02_17020 [Acidobacteria bacterium]|nr:hypothetical protein [Acidobacteriota bacterium]
MTTATPPPYGNRVEFAATRKIRERNTFTYRISHWPVWAWVYFLVPGPLIADLFHRGPDRRIGLWLAFVICATGIAAYFGKLPGTETRAYVLFFTEDKPNRVYRRVCYTVAWSVIVAYAAVNLAGMVIAILTGRWMMHQLYATAFVPVMAVVWGLGLAGVLPRARRSVKYEGYERRIFYGAVWTVAIAHPLLWVLWRAVPPSPTVDALKLVVFAGVMTVVGYVAYRGYLPRTKPIVPGEPITID